MANGFLAPFFTGALGEFSRQEVENDKIISKIIDNVSSKVLNQEIPEEQAAIKKALTYKNQYEANYGPEVAGVLDAAGVFNNPTDIGVENSLIRFFGTKDYNLDNFKTKVETYKADKPDNFDKIIGASFTDQRSTALENRKNFVNNEFSNTPNIRDLIISDETKEMTGVKGVLFGNRVDKKEAPAATLRLYDATQTDTSQVVSPLAIKSELGIEIPKEVEPFMTTELFTKLTSDAETRFDKDIKNANIKRSLETQFGVKKPDPGLKKSDPSEYAKQDAAYKNFMKMPAADRENIIRENFTKDYIKNKVSEMAEMGVPGAANYQTETAAKAIAQAALTRIAELQQYEKTVTASRPFDPDSVQYNADEDIEAIKAEARKQLTDLGLNPEDYGI
tara:strand:+ start:2386 stop:3558 length:1173 start_codon:yes stop_codon:yes gene_type:complete